MEVKATAKYVKVQPRKVRIIADEVRGLPANRTLSLLRYHPSKGAHLLRKVLVSAMANAEENHQISADNLKVSAIWIDEGPVMKRMQARAMGRGNRILKKTSHITVVVEDFEPVIKPKQKSKAKPRPTFAAPTKRGARKKGAEAPVEEVLQPEAAVEAVEAAPVVENEAATAPVEEATPVTASEAPEENTDQNPEVNHETTAEAEGAPSDEEKGAE
jgi:large subunit ribosomal protein L22